MKILTAPFLSMMLALHATDCLGVPNIIKQPSPLTNSVSLGDFLTNSIIATTTNPPLSYQWQFNSNTLTGVTNAKLVLTNVQLTNAGRYVVIVSDGDDSVPSSPWFVEVDPTFTKIMADPSVGPVGRASGAAWGDYNNDGYQDLCVTIVNGPNVLFTNNRNGTFTRGTTGPIVTGSAISSGGAWGDYDNDGLLDLFVSVGNGGNDFLFHNTGNGAFTRITTGSIVTSGGSGNGCGWADYDNDGYVDMYVCNSDQNNFLYHNNGNGTFTRILTGPPVTNTGNSQGCAWGDYDNDGRLDLYVTHYLSNNSLYRNNGNGTFMLVTNQPLVNVSSSGPSVWGDYDNDGYLDLFVGGQTGGTNLLYHNNGNGTFTKITSGPVATDTGNSIGAVWADFDNDGYQDLFVSQFGQRSQFYHNDGDGTFTRITSGSLVADGGTAGGCAWGDYDNDGFPDLFVTGNNANHLYHNNGNTNNWITIQCLGRLSNRAAIGAKIRIKASINGNAMWQLREISGGSATASQNDLRAQFGLRDATNVDLVRIEWPSGIVQEFRDVRARQILTIREPAKLDVAVPGQNEFRFALSGGKNVAYDVESSTNLVDWTYQFTVTNSAASLRLTNAMSAAPALYFRVREP